MTRFDKDAIGNRMKAYEEHGFTRAYILPGESFVVRLDGRSFSYFTRNFEKPYDKHMSFAMQTVMRKLTEEFDADLGYTQSDEISLVFFSNVNEQILFAGRVQKLITSMAARASVLFNVEMMKCAPQYIEDGREPTFDARIVPVPNRIEAFNCILWRQQDATKNAISMAAHSMFSNDRLHGLSGPEKQELMFSEKGVNFNDYPTFFKRGVFARPEVVEMPLDEETLNKMPPAIAEQRRGEMYRRRQVKIFDCWIMKSGDTLEERFKALFGDARI